MLVCSIFVLKKFSVFISKSCAQDGLDHTLLLKSFLMEHLRFLIITPLSNLMDNMKALCGRVASSELCRSPQWLKALSGKSLLFSLTYLLLCLVEYFVLKSMFELVWGRIYILALDFCLFQLTEFSGLSWLSMLKNRDYAYKGPFKIWFDRLVQC